MPTLSPTLIVDFALVFAYMYLFPGRVWYVLSFLDRQYKLIFAVIRIRTEDAVT